VILIRGDTIYTESTAVLEIVKQLGRPWSWIGLLELIPRDLRDAGYRFVVRHRYQWFGGSEACQAQPADVRMRFIDWHLMNRRLNSNGARRWTRPPRLSPLEAVNREQRLQA